MTGSDWATTRHLAYLLGRGIVNTVEVRWIRTADIEQWEQPEDLMERFYGKIEEVYISRWSRSYSLRELIADPGTREALISFYVFTRDSHHGFCYKNTVALKEGGETAVVSFDNEHMMGYYNAGYNKITFKHISIEKFYTQEQGIREWFIPPDSDKKAYYDDDREGNIAQSPIDYQYVARAVRKIMAISDVDIEEAVNATTFTDEQKKDLAAILKRNRDELCGDIEELIRLAAGEAVDIQALIDQQEEGAPRAEPRELHQPPTPASQ